MNVSRTWIPRLACAALLLALTVETLKAADLLRLDDGGSVVLRILGTGATEVTSHDPGAPALRITQVGAGKALAVLDGASESFTVADGGNVGIGVPAPTQRLSVAGNVAVTGTVDGVDLSTHASSASAHHAPTVDTFVTNKNAHDHLGGDGARIQHSSLGGVSGSGHAPTQTAANVVYGGPGSNADAWHTHSGLGGGGAGTYQYLEGSGSTYSYSWRPVLNVTGPGMLYAVRSVDQFAGVRHEVRVIVDGLTLFSESVTTTVAGEPFDFHQFGKGLGLFHVPFKTSLKVEIRRSSGSGTVSAWVRYGR